MEKKHPVRKVILSILAVLIIAALAAVPFILERMKATVEDKGSLLSSQVSLASITKTVSGAGTLTDEDPVEIKLPYGVEVTKYLVDNNDFVTEGQALAEVDRISVMNSIYNYQQDLEYVESQMALYTDTGATNFLTTTSAGRVMELYADVGDSINDVMLEHGALAVLSLDGLLAVDCDCGNLAVGSTVGVQSSDGGIVPGHIESKKNGVSVITLDQYDQTVGDPVTILNSGYEPIGSGVLYVHSPLKITGYSGTIEAVHVKLGQDMYAGGTLFTYSGNSNSAEYGVYSAKHTELAGYVDQLFKMYTEGTVNAECAGVISGIDEDAAAELLSANGEDTGLSFLTNVATLESSGNSAKISTTANENLTYPCVYYESGKISYMLTGSDVATAPGNSWLRILRTDRRYSDRLEAINAVAGADREEFLSFEQLNNYGIATDMIGTSNISKIIFVFEYYCESPDTYRLNSISTEISGLTVWASTTGEEKTASEAPEISSLVSGGSKAELVALADESVPQTPYFRVGKILKTVFDDKGTGVAYYALSDSTYLSMEEVVYSINAGTVDMREVTGSVLDVPSYCLTTSNVNAQNAYLLVTYFGGSRSPSMITLIDSTGQYVAYSDSGKGISGDDDQSEIQDGSNVGTELQTDTTSSSTTSDSTSSGGGSMSGMSSSSSAEKAYSYYSTRQTTIMSVTPQDTMSVDITIDELDILSIERGQDVQITLDALTGQSFDGIITDIGVSGSNSGGNTKYTAEVTIDRAANMIAGMNATALITLDSSDGLLTLPSEAIMCDGTRNYVYTGYDEKTETLINPVDITVGASDGITTEVSSGLSAGDTVWYNYLDKPDNTFDFSGMPAFPQMG